MTTLAEQRIGRWHALREVAVRGLRLTYDDSSCVLPHTRHWNGYSVVSKGDNPRYALIALLGLARAASSIRGASDLPLMLWGRVKEARARWSPTPGDRGLGLWASAMNGVKERLFTATDALAALRRSGTRCDAVELAWLLLGADHAMLADMNVESAARLADETRDRLLALYNPDSALFYRHSRRAGARAISRRVPCFAHQIYPLMALSVHARRTGCSRCSHVARAVANRLCTLQGPLGQWWWLYDATNGAVVDGYPVFSVHQDGMAPMALMEAARVVGRSYDQEIERGLDWVFGENELDEDLVLADQGLILRDIHCRGVGRVRRALRAALWCAGSRGQLSRTAGEFVVNRECRPYHLGWVLYAAALRHEAEFAAMTPTGVV